MKAKIGRRGDAEQINYKTQTKPDKVHVLKLYKVQKRKAWNFRVVKIRFPPKFKICDSQVVLPVWERFCCHAVIFNFKKQFPIFTICWSFPRWPLWWRKARWYFEFGNLISVLALLLSGGLYNSSVVPMNFVELWSPDRQCSLDPLPFPMEGHTTDWVDNSLVVCGGLNGSSWTTAPCTRFKNGTWQPLKNTKHQRWIFPLFYFLFQTTGAGTATRARY